MDKLTLGLVAALGALAGCLLTLGSPAAALAVVATGAVVAAMAKHARESRARARGEVLYDEMHVALAERASFTALRASLIAVSAAVALLVWPELFGVELVPSGAADRIWPGLALSMAVMSAAYLASYAYYSRSSRVVEG